jgi:hypothetical protein
MNHLSLLISQILNGEGHWTFHPIQVIVDTQAFQHEQWSCDSAQPEFRAQVLLKELLNQLDALLRLFHVQFRLVVHGLQYLTHSILLF